MSIRNVRGFLPGESALPDEVVTRALVRDVDLGAVVPGTVVPGAVVPGKGAGVMALITLDNGHDHTKPNTFGVRGLLSLNAALDAIEARVAAGEVAAVGVTGKPFILGAGADLD
ncbi:MAG: hypothetical protein WAK28_19245, partial [Trebonia sp.]